MTNFSGFQQADTYAHSPFIEVRRNGMQLLPANTVIKAEYDDVQTNENGCWSSINHWFAAPKAGRLQINVSFGIGEISSVPSVFAFLAEVHVANSAGVVYSKKRYAQYNDLKVGFVSIVGSSAHKINQGDLLWFNVGIFGTNGQLLGTTFSGGVELTHATIYYLP